MVGIIYVLNNPPGGSVLRVKSVDLYTNNPDKMSALQSITKEAGRGVGSWSLRLVGIGIWSCFFVFLVGFQRPNVNKPKKDTTKIHQNSKPWKGNLQCVGHYLPIFGTEMTVVFSCCVLRLNAMREDMEYREIPGNPGINRHWLISKSQKPKP